MVWPIIDLIDTVGGAAAPNTWRIAETSAAGLPGRQDRETCSAAVAFDQPVVLGLAAAEVVDFRRVRIKVSVGCEATDFADHTNAGHDNAFAALLNIHTSPHFYRRINADYLVPYPQHDTYNTSQR